MDETNPREEQVALFHDVFFTIVPTDLSAAQVSEVGRRVFAQAVSQAHIL